MLTLLDIAPVRIWLLDAGHSVRWANRAACAVFGLPLERILRMAREDFGYPGDPGLAVTDESPTACTWNRLEGSDSTRVNPASGEPVS